MGIFHENNNWYILGYCLLRQDYRQFRTDRILHIAKSNQRFTRSHPALSTFFEEKTNFPRIKVRLLVDRKIAHYLGATRLNYGFVSETVTEKGIEMYFETIEISESFPRWFLGFGDYIQVLEPEELKANIRQLISRIHL